MDTWPLYLRLQTDYAYAGAAADEEAEPPPPPLPAPQTLIIGPGGVREVAAIRGQTAGPIVVLTAFERERTDIHGAVEGTRVVIGDMHEMPFATGSFSAVFASNVLEHALAPYIALVECRRVLAGSGRAIFVLPSFEGREGGHGPFHLHCLTADVWMELLRKTGFVVNDTIRQPGGEDPTGHYMHYHCSTVEPPYPHDRVRAAIIRAARRARPRSRRKRKKQETASPETALGRAHPDEMVFVLLGRDAAAPAAIRAWAAERVRLGKNTENDLQIVEAGLVADTMEREGRQWAGHPVHYPLGMGPESRRLHREYNRLVAEQMAGAKNGPSIIALCDECAAKGIILVPGGEHL